jgi:hypothetical protein
VRPPITAPPRRAQVHPDGRDKIFERGAQLVLIFIERVVHLPEQAVRSGKLGRLGGALGVRVDYTHRKKLEYESEVLGELPAHQVDDGMRRLAVRAFVIAVFDEGDGSVGSPLTWSSDVTGTFNMAMTILSSASRIPPGPD